MSMDSTEKSIQSIGMSIVFQTTFKWVVIAFLGWLVISSIGDWLSIIFSQST